MKWTSYPAKAWHGLSVHPGEVFAGEAPDVQHLAGRLNEGSSPGAIEPIHPALLALASRVADIFEIEAPDSPGVFFVGAMTTPARHLDAPEAAGKVSAGACGATFRRAVISCLGEMAERLAQFGSKANLTMTSPGRFGEGLDDQSRKGLLDLIDQAPRTSEELPGILAHHLSGDGYTTVPARLCLQLPGDIPSVNPSIGCACGPTAEAAILAGLHEWIERDAAALWWNGGRPARQVSLEVLEEAGLLEMIPTIRRGRSARRTWFLDITSDLSVPCVACVSVTVDGRGFAHGAAARPSMAAAANAAFLELCQMEVAWHLMELKRAAGHQPTSPADLRHQARFEGVDVDALAMLAPRLPPAGAGVPGHDLERLVGHLAAAGYPSLAVDLSQPEIGLPVFKVIVPGLQPLPSAVTTARLSQAAASPSSLGCAGMPLY